MTILQQRCVEKYFEFTLLSREFDSDKKRSLFKLLSETYMLDGTELFSMCEDKTVAAVTDEEKFKRLKRLDQFFKEERAGERMPKDVMEIVDAKGRALYALRDAGVLEEGMESTDRDRVGKLMRAADDGRITAMFMAAVLNMEGYLAPQNVDMGRKFLDRLSRWPNADGLLLSLRYGAHNVKEDMSKLYTATYGLSEAFIYAAAKKRYGVSADVPDANMQILKKAIGKGDLARQDTYRSQLARIAFSEVLADKDKHKALFSSDGEFVKAVSSLPLKLSAKATAPALGDIVTPLGRKAEQAKVRKVASSIAVTAADKVCFRCDDMYVLRAYMQAIEDAASGCNVKCFKLEDIAAKLAEPSEMNVLLRAVDECKPNLFLIEIAPTLGRAEVEALKDVLDDSKRAHFSVAPCNVELDLSGVTFVLFCHGSAVKYLQSGIFAVRLAEVSEAERQKVLGDAISSEEAKWGVSFDDGAAQRLGMIDIIDALRVVSLAAQQAYFEDARSITGEAVSDCCTAMFGTKSFGFGRG